jgi:hypothetical protein
MSISKTTKSIGGRTIEFHRCATTEGLELQLALIKTIGKVDISSLLAAAAGDAGKAIALVLSDAVANIAKNLSIAELTRLMELVFKYITIDGHPFHDINADFSDRPLDVWQAFIAAVEHNLGPLVAELRQKFTAK